MSYIKATLITTLLLGSVATADSNYLKNTFVGVSAGYSYLNVDQKNIVNTIDITNEIQESGYNLTLQAGYHHSKNVDISLNYQRVEQDDTYQNNFYLATEFKVGEFNQVIPYIGAQLGYSQLTWSKNPVNTTDNDIHSDSYMGGVNLGARYPLSNNLELNMKYELNFMNHTTMINLLNAQSQLTHNSAHNLNVGG